MENTNINNEQDNTEDTIDIGNRIEALIPADLYAKYSHLSYAEMAEIDELEEYKDDLLQAEIDRNKAEGQ